MMEKRRALVLEDDPIIREMLTDVLETVDFEVSAFPNPTEFLRLWSHLKTSEWSSGFDLMLSDNRMPGMTGLEFMTLMNQGSCVVPVRKRALISGSWDDSELESARRLNCHVFHKPSPISEIYQWIDQGEKLGG